MRLTITETRTLSFETDLDLPAVVSDNFPEEEGGLPHNTVTTTQFMHWVENIAAPESNAKWTEPQRTVKIEIS